MPPPPSPQEKMSAYCPCCISTSNSRMKNERASTFGVCVAHDIHRGHFLINPFLGVPIMYIVENIGK